MKDVVAIVIGKAGAQRISERFDTASNLLTAIQDGVYAADDKDMVRLASAFHGTKGLLLAALHSDANVYSSPRAVASYLSANFQGRRDEAFMVLYLDNQNRLIAAREVATGSISSTTVYPRTIVREALELNAGAVIFAHHHPSGATEPSHADRVLTDSLRNALAHLEVRVLDHVIVGSGAQTYSFAEHGLV